MKGKGMKGKGRNLLILLGLLSVFAAGCGGSGGGIGGGTGDEWTDTTAPKVTLTVPVNSATNVPINTRIAATFNEPMDPATIIANETFRVNETVSGNTVSGTVTFNSDGTAATFTPNSALAYNRGYTATITTGATDMAGNALVVPAVGGLPVPNPWTFTTGTAPDTTAPTVTLTVPVNGATHVLINRKITAAFSEPMDPATIIANATFRVNETVSGDTVFGTVTCNSNGTAATFTPNNILKPTTEYKATITTGAEDMAGNALVVPAVDGLPVPNPWTFTTGTAADTTAPTVTLTDPVDGDTGVAINSSVTATFSEAMFPATIIANETFTVNETVSGDTVLGSVTFNADGTTAIFTPNSVLTDSTQYTATITTGAEDLSGNALVPGLIPNPWTFTTGEGLAPRISPLGTAATYGIMATAAITSTGNSVVNGDISLDPGTSMTGFPPGVYTGTYHNNDAESEKARIDLLVAYNLFKSMAPGTTISGGADLGALYPLGIPPGTYTSGSTMYVSTPLVLDAGGNADAVWIFQIGSSLTTGASVSLANGAQAKNVFWVPTEDATIGVGTIFYGTIVSGRDVTAVTGAVINGRILAGAITDGTVALQNSTINVPRP